MEALFSDYEDIRKSGLFDAEYYLATYPDVAERNTDPLVHYLEQGALEGRNPHADFDAGYYLEQCRLRGEQANNPLLHYIRIGAARGFKTRRDKEDREVLADKPADRRLRATDRAGQPPILVAIEALGIVGATEGTSSLSISGWAVAAAPIVEIAIAIEGEIAGTATCGLARPDIARLYPDRAGAPRCGFILAVDIPHLKSSAIEPLLIVRTADGATGEHPLRVEVPPQEVEVGVRETGKTPMQLSIDDATTDPGGLLRVQGWVVCLVQIESVEAFIDGARIGKAEFGRVREDIEKMHPGYPNARFSGFALVADVSGHGSGSKTIAIKATARGGIVRVATAPVEITELPTAGASIPDLGFHYHCDEVTLTRTGRLTLRGWAVCPSPGTVVVFLDGEKMGHAEPGPERPDIGNLFPGLAHARQPSFTFNAQTGRSFTGEHLVTLQLCREDGQTHEALLPVFAGGGNASHALAATGDPDIKLYIDTPNLIGGLVDAPVRGNLDISGWALARAGVAAIEIAIDNTPVALADHGLRRLDLTGVFPDWADALASGYQALLPHRFLPKGSHRVSVTLRDKAGKEASLGFGIEVEELSEAPGPWSLGARWGRPRSISIGVFWSAAGADRCSWSCYR